MTATYCRYVGRAGRYPRARYSWRQLFMSTGTKVLWI